MQNQPARRALRAAALVAAVAACLGAAVSGCGGATAGAGPAPGTSAGAPSATSSSTPPATAADPVHLTGNFCADVATMNSRVRALTEAVVTAPGGGQQRARTLVATLAGTYAALGSEAPSQLKASLAKLASFYQATENKLASGGGRLALFDIEPARHPGLVTAVRQLSSYLIAHCGAA